MDLRVTTTIKIGDKELTLTAEELEALKRELAKLGPGTHTVIHVTLPYPAIVLPEAFPQPLYIPPSPPYVPWPTRPAPVWTVIKSNDSSISNNLLVT